MMNKEMPQWQRALAEIAARKAKARTCPACGAPILVGLDNDRCAHTVAADPRPLTWGGELAAALSGRHTFEYAAEELHRRDHDRRRSPPPFGPPVAAHICGQPLPDHWHAPPTQRKDTAHDECPY